MTDKKNKTLSKKKKTETKEIYKIAELKKQCKLNIEEIEKLKDKNIRLLAEFDNYKRRSQEEKNKLFLYAGEDIVKSFLPILDDLNRSLEPDNVNSNSMIEGIELIINNLKKVFKENGICSFSSKGEKFDPELHEAVMNETSNKKEGIILREFQLGYKYHEKIIRHSKVVVSKKK